MTARKNRIEIPREIAAKVQFDSDRTCCVCRVRKPFQIHHIDENPTNCQPDNLAILCFDCHHGTQIRGGFARKLDGSQILLYKRDWLNRVATMRDKVQPASNDGPINAEAVRTLKFMQQKESSDEYLYSLEAEFPQIDSGSSKTDAEINHIINVFVVRHFQEFRAMAIRNEKEKNSAKQEINPAIVWDSLSISHDISLFTADLLAIRFSMYTYYSMAAHPNTHTATLNFRLRPPMELKLENIFKPSSNYLNLLSHFCVKDLHRQQPLRWSNPEERAEWLKHRQDEWILSGAAPSFRNLERFVLAKGGIRIFFDPYQVGSYAEGKYDVFVPTYVLEPALEDFLTPLLT